MIDKVIPQFFTTDLAATLAYYRDALGFETLFVYGDPPFYAAASRDGQQINFRHVDDAPPQMPGKYDEEYLDAFIGVQDIETLHAEYAAKGVSFTRALAATAWSTHEFVVRDCDGRLLCFSRPNQ